MRKKAKESTKKGKKSNMKFTGVPGIMAFIRKDIKPLIFFLFFGFV
jgi:hypothetical protein